MSGCDGYPVTKTEIHEYEHECHCEQQLARPHRGRQRDYVERDTGNVQQP